MYLSHYDNWPSAKRLLEALRFVDEIPTEVLETLNKDGFSLYSFIEEAAKDREKLDYILDDTEKVYENNC